MRSRSLAALVLLGACSEDGGAGGADAAAPQPDAGIPYRELPLEPTAPYLGRKAEYFAHCFDGSAPGIGSFYGQVCRVAGGGEVDADAVAEALDKVERRLDTADFRAAALVRMLLLDRETGALDAATRAAIEESLLGFKYWLDEPGEDGMAYWTENHQALFHSSELLAGQLFPDEVFPNAGMTGAEHAAHAEPMVERWLDERGRFGFSEWHSNVYFNEDMPAVVNLADFAGSERIRTKAAMVLDLMAFDLLNNTYKGFFATVHGRTYPNHFLGGLRDSTRVAAWILLGLGDYDSPGDFSGSFLATSDYFAPGLLEEIAAAVAARHEHRQRDGIDVADGPMWGIGYEDYDDLVFWAGMAALVAPQVVEGTAVMLDDLGLWDGFLFGALPEEALGLLRAMASAGTLDDFARDNEAFARGIALEAMDTYVYRTPDYQLAGAQDYNPGFWALQTQIWQATLDGAAFVFTSYPSALDGAPADADIAGEWIGSWLPRATFHRNVGVLQYRVTSAPLTDTLLTTSPTHAYFPRAGFDEVRESAGAHWTFGRKGDGYVALWSQAPTAWAEDNDYELTTQAMDNVWVVELGSAADSGSFDAFVGSIESAAVAVGDAVTYASPSLGAVEVGWDGPMTVAGMEADLGPYDRWDNEFAHVAFGDAVTVIEQGRLGTDGLRLSLDFAAARRRLLAPE